MRVPPEDRGMVVANLLSASRIPLAGLLWVAPASTPWVLAVMAVAGLTDVLDGWVIRRWRRMRWAERDPGARAALVGRGAVIDGLADKVFVVSVVLVLHATLRPPAWALALLLSRELLFVPIGLAYRLSPRSVRDRVDFTAGIPGKLATVVQFAALVLGLLDHPFFLGACVAAGALGLVSVVYYVGRVFLGRGDEPEPGHQGMG